MNRRTDNPQTASENESFGLVTVDAAVLGFLKENALEDRIARIIVGRLLWTRIGTFCPVETHAGAFMAVPGKGYSVPLIPSDLLEPWSILIQRQKNDPVRLLGEMGKLT